MNLEFELSRTHLPVASIYRHADQASASVAYTDGCNSLTFGELFERVRAAAARLADKGVGRGDRVVLVAGNSVDFAVPVYAASYLGAIIVPVNYRLAGGEIAYILGNCTPAAVVADEQRMAVVGKAARDCDAALLDLAELATRGATPGTTAAIPDPVICSPTDDQAIMYTSGTTGRPKGAVLTYSNFITVVQGLVSAWDYEPGRDTVLICTPMFHIAAFNVMTANIAQGVTSYISPPAGFDPANLLDVMEQYRVTQTFMIPAQWQAIAAEQQRQPRELQLKFWVWGASPASHSLLETMGETFPRADSQSAFGQTETSALGVSLSHADSYRKLGSVGLPNPNFSIRVVDENMNDVTQGEVGEIVYRGPGVMSRYWNNEIATAKAFAGGWFHSGDLVYQDEEGFIYVVDRAKDMIISGGENIYSAELENVIAGHAGVAEVAVVARSDDKWGEIPVAVVIPANNEQPPTLDEVRAHCDGKLAKYKLPRDLVVLDEFPRGGTGKVQKNQLREQIR